MADVIQFPAPELSKNLGNSGPELPTGVGSLPAAVQFPGPLPGPAPEPDWSVIFELRDAANARRVADEMREYQADLQEQLQIRARERMLHATCGPRLRLVRP
jgi:hypothetical protein